MNGLSIGEVASRAGLRASALRYYEQVGLVAPQIRVNGQRRYDPGVFRTLTLIAFAKEVGFTIAETKLLLSGFGADVPPPARWRALTRRKEEELDALIARARRMKRLLQAAAGCRCPTLEECGRRLGASAPWGRATSTPVGHSGRRGARLARRDDRGISGHL